MIIKYSDNNENRIEWQHRRGEEWKTAELDELIEAYEREKTGKWVLNDNGTFSCSLCQSWIPNEQHHYARYCLYCGARMVD